MTWDNGGDSSWNDGFGAQGFTADAGGFTDDVFDKKTSNDGGFNGQGGGRDVGGDAGGDDNCRNCGQTGHFSRECPEPKQQTGECYNCGEIGHNQVECTNPRVERPFAGTCRVCDKEGHQARDCPEKTAEICRICKEEGHKAIECKAPRMDVYGGVAAIGSEEAWKAMMIADKDLDVDDFKTAFLQYCQALVIAGSPVDVGDLEIGFRASNLNIHLIAKTFEEEDTTTIVSMAGQAGQKYKLVFSWSAKAKRQKLSDGWPANPEENMQRLSSCGFPCDGLIPKCSRCNTMGHIRKHCKSDAPEVEEATRVEVKCAVCGLVGHRARDCTEDRVDPFACRNCKQSGHNSKECPEPRSAEGVECKVCSVMGHFSRDCPTAPKFACRNCGEEGHRASECQNERVITCRNCEKEGHVSRDCTEPKNPANSQCRNCDEMGHFSKDCPKPRDYSKVQCRNCGEMGHTVVRCKQPKAEDGIETGGVEVPSSMSFDAVGPTVSGGNEWETPGAAGFSVW